MYLSFALPLCSWGWSHWLSSSRGGRISMTNAKNTRAIRLMSAWMNQKKIWSKVIRSLSLRCASQSYRGLGHKTPEPYLFCITMADKVRHDLVTYKTSHTEQVNESLHNCWKQRTIAELICKNLRELSGSLVQCKFCILLITLVTWRCIYRALADKEK